MKFSIVLPIYNGMPVAKRAITSALSQKGVDFNVVIIDNGCCDDLALFLKTLSDDRLNLYSYPEIVDIEYNWARILKIDLNDYITLLGHDDFLQEDFLQKISVAIESHPKCILFGTSGNMVDENNNILRKINLSTGQFTLEQYLRERFSFKRDVSGTGFVFKSEDYKYLGGLPKFKKLFFSDDAFWISLLTKGDGFVVDDTGYEIMLHKNSVSATSPSIGIDLLVALESFYNFLIENVNHQKDVEISKLLDNFFSGTLDRCTILIHIDNLRPEMNSKEDRLRKLAQVQLDMLSKGYQLRISLYVKLFCLILKFFPNYYFANMSLKGLKKIKEIFK